MKMILRLILFLYGFLCLMPYTYANSKLDFINLNFSPYQSYQDSLITVNDISNKLYFLDSNDLNKVYVLDLNKNATTTVILNMGTKGENDDLHLTDDFLHGKVLKSLNKVLFSRGTTLSIIDGISDSLINTFTFSQEIVDFEINQNSGKVWVVINDPSAPIVAINDITQTLSETFIVKNNDGMTIQPGAIFYYPKKNELILLGNTNDILSLNNLFILNPDNKSLIDTIDFKGKVDLYSSSFERAFNQNTGRLYIRSLNKISIIDVENRSYTGEIDIEKSTLGGSAISSGSIGVSSILNEIYTVKAADQQLLIIDGSSNKIIDVSLVDFPHSIGVSEVNGKVYVGSVIPIPPFGFIKPFLQVINRNSSTSLPLTYVRSLNGSISRLNDYLARLKGVEKNKAGKLAKLINEVSSITNKVNKALASSEEQCKHLVNNLVNTTTLRRITHIHNLIGSICKEVTITNTIPEIGQCNKNVVNIGTELEITRNGLRVDIDNDGISNVCQK